MENIMKIKQNLIQEVLADLFSDKVLVIATLLILGVAIIYSSDLTPIKVHLLNSIISGLLGIAVGRNLPVKK
jgi:hypothetical protein